VTKLASVKVKARALVGNLLARIAEIWLTASGLRVTNPLILATAPSSKVAVISFFGRNNGISAGALWQIEALSAAGISAVQLDATPAIRKPWYKLPPLIGIDTTSLIVHTDGKRVAVALNAMPRGLLAARRIGYCAWELPDPPLDWGQFDRFLHEVWTPSEFSRQALQVMCSKPVRVVRHVVRAPANANGHAMRQRLNLRDTDFVVLAMADVRSSLARKNPIGAITAFKQGLGAYSNAVLVLKVTGADHDPVAFDALRFALQGSRVLLLLDRLSMSEQWQLYAACDVFVSLHRAEGYGLPMAEAMAMGRPVVATGWSGNLDFMHAENAALVDHTLVKIDDPQGVYSGSNWAEPSLAHAAEWLARLYASPLLRADMGAAAAKSMALPLQMAEFATQIGLRQ
jgi:glycosyltransferase involved in cell wall biosynthesis